MGLTLGMILVFRLYDYAWLRFNAPLKRHTDHLCELIDASQPSFFSVNTFSGGQANKIHAAMDAMPDVLKMLVDHFLGQFLCLLTAVFTMWTVDFRFALALLCGAACTSRLTLC